MKTRLACLAAYAAAALLVAGEPAPVAAQPVFYPGSPAVLPPHEILTIVRSAGLAPLGRPLRSGGALHTSSAAWATVAFQRPDGLLR